MGVQLIRYRRMGSSPAPAPPPPTTDNPTEKRTTVSTLSHLLMLTWKTKILMTRKTMRLELRSLESSLVQFSQNQLSQETQLQHLLVRRACLVNLDPEGVVHLVRLTKENYLMTRVH